MDSRFFMIVLAFLSLAFLALYIKARNNLLASIEDENPEDLRKLMSNRFSDKYIDNPEVSRLREKYQSYYKHAATLNQKMKFLHVKNDKITSFVFCYEHLYELADEHNSMYETKQMDANKTFFDTVLKYPLDNQQRRAIVSEATNCLVVSSAGSGKTSSIVGKVKYLIEKKHIDPKRILLISYTNKAAAELTVRMGINGLHGLTFHKLAIDIIGEHTKEKPCICDNTDALLVDIYHELLKSKSFRRNVLQYVIDFQAFQTEEEKRNTEERERLSAMKQDKYKSLFPDMDGKPIYTRSKQEQKLCFVLSSLGLRFRYEEPYEHRLADETHSQYRPDFSIHYTKNGVQCRAYLEHFGVDEHGNVPAWFSKDKGLSYEEANRRYGDGITWKREAHKKYGTVLLETSSADFRYLDIKEKVKSLLRKNGIPFTELSDNDIYRMVMPEGSKQEKVFIRLIVTFITLMKTNCRTAGEILKSAKRTGDKRAEMMVSGIVSSVFGMYEKKLQERQQKDFTDLILDATKIVKQHKKTTWDYIVVDEFQDISVDRYKFLQALRDGVNPAKLFCVGDDWQSIYRFSGSDLALFSQFERYFGRTETCKIETTYRFGNPLVNESSDFIQRNPAQIKKNIKPFSSAAHTELVFQEYEYSHYVSTLRNLISNIPSDKSVFLLGRYSFDDYNIARSFKSIKRGNRFYYIIEGREIEFLTVHKSKGLEADYVVLLQCNKGIFGFPATMGDDPVLNVVLSKNDDYPYGEERRLFYVAITRAKIRTTVLYDRKTPSAFIKEFLYPQMSAISPNANKTNHKNANKKWEKRDDKRLLNMYYEKKTVSQMSETMGRSRTAIVMRLKKLGVQK